LRHVGEPRSPSLLSVGRDGEILPAQDARLDRHVDQPG